MFEVIICDDNKKDRKNTYNIVNDFFNKSNLEYKIIEFSEYNSNFYLKSAELNVNKIYILDIETPGISGIDVAREIRKNDLTSPIIFLTVHNNLQNIVLRSDFVYVSYINKFESMQSRLCDILTKIVKINNKRIYIRFNDNNSKYLIDISKILYITRDSYDRKVIIKTDTFEIKILKSLKEVKELLDDRFVQTHRACIVNKNRILEINIKEKYIIFDNLEKNLFVIW